MRRPAYEPSPQVKPVMHSPFDIKPPWPLLHKGIVDVYDGVCWGVIIRGELITAPLIGTNWLFGALAGQGKTATMRLLALGVALDVTTEIRIVNFKPSGDWNAFKPRAAVLLSAWAPRSSPRAQTNCNS